tara:strand:+ start:127 stop:417 length:291 start_codon:yes stop_codon:yes gene_type:complete
MINEIAHDHTKTEEISKLTAQFKYLQLTGNTKKRHVIIWGSNTHSTWNSTPNGDGTDTTVGWRPIYKWQLPGSSQRQFQKFWRNMHSLLNTGSLAQ